MMERKHGNVPKNRLNSRSGKLFPNLIGLKMGEKKRDSHYYSYYSQLQTHARPQLLHWNVNCVKVKDFFPGTDTDPRSISSTNRSGSSSLTRSLCERWAGDETFVFDTHTFSSSCILLLFRKKAEMINGASEGFIALMHPLEIDHCCFFYSAATFKKTWHQLFVGKSVRRHHRCFGLYLLRLKSIINT